MFYFLIFPVRSSLPSRKIVHELLERSLCSMYSENKAFQNTNSHGRTTLVWNYYMSQYVPYSAYAQFSFTITKIFASSKICLAIIYINFFTENIFYFENNEKSKKCVGLFVVLKMRFRCGNHFACKNVKQCRCIRIPLSKSPKNTKRGDL